MHTDLQEILLTEEQIHQRVQEMGRQITKDYAGKTILMCGILKERLLFLRIWPVRSIALFFLIL